MRCSTPRRWISSPPIAGFSTLSDRLPIWAFGRDDLIFADNLKLYAWDALPVPPYSNVIPWFAEHGIDLRGKHACDVAEASGAVFDRPQA